MLPSTDIVFDSACEALNALTPQDVPDQARPFAVVHGTTPVAWFASFPEAGVFARARFAPETYAIGNPLAEPDFLPMFFVQQPLA
jgi:hypothetical protein